jgi:hypothetical protein
MLLSQIGVYIYKSYNTKIRGNIKYHTKTQEKQ